MIRRERLTANLEGDFVVFLIGMRINKPWKAHKWLPVATAMPRMIKELYRQPELGFSTRGNVVLSYHHHGAVLAFHGTTIGLCQEQGGSTSPRMAIVQQGSWYRWIGWHLARNICGLAWDVRKHLRQYAAIRFWQGGFGTSSYGWSAVSRNSAKSTQQCALTWLKRDAAKARRL